ncbi:hypothetical protein GCM10027342_38640 [Photobacterium alginatilyticum]
MKEIMLPYIFIVWILFKFKVLAPTAKNYFITTSLGVILLIALFLGHRFYSPIDLTNSTTVKAPHAVLSPTLGQHIDKVFVDHNTQVSQGDVLYTLKDDKITAAITEVESGLVENQRRIEAQEVRLAQANRNLNRSLGMDKHVSIKELEEAQDYVDLTVADLKVMEAQKEGLLAKKRSLEFDLSRLTVTAPFDGLITHVYIADGSRVGSLHIWDTSKKFVEMRIHVYTGPVFFSNIVSLFIRAIGVDDFKKIIHQLLNRDNFRIKLGTDTFSIAIVLTFRGGGCTVGSASFSRDNTWQMPKIFLHAPKAPSGKVNFFHFLFH